MKHALRVLLLLLFSVITASTVNAEADKIELNEGYKFAMGAGAAIVKFDTKIKVLDKQNNTRIFLDPEGNLDLPETSSVKTVYGSYNFNDKHSVGFSFFSVRRESRILDIDKTFEDVDVVGDAMITDTTSFYSLDYRYTLFRDDRSRIKLLAGIYGLDLKYAFEAEGEGRNAVWLAEQGNEVTAVDASEIGLKKADKLAKERGVKIITVHADLADYDIGIQQWDTIISIFYHLPPDLRQNVHRRSVKGLRDGGMILIEAYTPLQLQYKTGGPPSAEMMMDVQSLCSELVGPMFLHLQEQVREIHEGEFHNGVGAVVQALARKW